MESAGLTDVKRTSRIIYRPMEPLSSIPEVRSHIRDVNSKFLHPAILTIDEGVKRPRQVVVGI